MIKQHSKYILTTLLFIATIVTTHAQYYGIKQAHEQFELYNYSVALPLYEKIYEKQKSVEAARGIASCYRMLNDYTFAESWYAKVLNSKKYQSDDVIQYAEVLMNNSKYLDAKDILQNNTFTSTLNLNNKVVHMMASCDSSLHWMRDPGNAKWKNLSALNSSGSDWGAASYQDKIVFSSDRSSSRTDRKDQKEIDHIIKRNVGTAPDSYFKLYEVNKDATDTSVKIWEKGFENQSYHTGSPCFSKDQKQVFFTRTRKLGKKRSLNDQTINVEIFWARYDQQSQKWSEPIPFPYNNVLKYSLGDPFITSDDSTLYFTANMPGGVGGTDLYFCKRLPGENKWSEPANMGLDINTTGNERTAYIDDDGVFYFSTDGRIGMGGLDIYKATKNTNTAWQNTNSWHVVNMGYPVNSPQEDFAYRLLNGHNGYFSSDRFGGKGSDDIYSIQYEQRLKTTFSGVIADEQGMLLSGVVATLRDLDDHGWQVQPTDENGSYTFYIEPPKLYELSLLKTDYISTTDTLFTAGIRDGEVVYNNENLLLEKAVIGSAFTLKNNTTQRNNSALVQNRYINSNKTANNNKITTSSNNQQQRTNATTAVTKNGNTTATTNNYTNATASNSNNGSYGTGIVSKNKNNGGTWISSNKDKNIADDGYENIYYDLNKWNIRPDAMPALNNLARMLKNNPTFEVSICAHTDSRGDKVSNLILSQKRAESVVAYLIKQGITANRLTARGMGSSRLINKCSSGVPCSEQQHQANRRTEFVIENK